MRHARAVQAAWISALAAILSGSAGAQDAARFPSKPVRVVVPQAPGGATDIQARLLAVVPSFTFSPALYRNYPVDPVKEFEPVSLLTRAPYLLVVNASMPARSVQEFIVRARAQPDGPLFGAGNTGSGTHLVTMWFLSAANVRASYVPYRSVGLAMLDLIGGRIDATLANVLSVGPYVKAGKLRALGISTARRSRVYPDLPTIAEQGVPGY